MEETFERFSVRSYVAAGDGKADDTASIQKAIAAALQAGGGRIHFPSGRYRITRSLKFTSMERVDVTGAGWSTQLLQEEDEPLFLWPEGVSCREVSIRHFRLLSTRKDKSLNTPMIACLGGVERSFFQHLLFTHEGAKTGSGVLTRNVADTTTFDQCLMWEISGTGIELARGSEIRIFGGRITGDGRFHPKNVGIVLTGNNGGVHIVTTDLIGLHTGMKVGTKGQTSNREIFITHATFDSSLHGLWQIDHAYTSIAGCWAASCDEEQILLDEGAHGAILAVSGGTIFNGGAYGRPGAHHGIVVKAGRFSLTGVSVRHNKGVGILVEGETVRDYTITGCRIHNNGTGAILSGQRYVLSGNLFTENETHLVEKGKPKKRKSGNLLT
ncbi:MAG: hypothetical protein KY468_07355 [Armatimonadetes bacterium]|nr:hypothetical protein [Armatimonadota bacterium]